MIAGEAAAVKQKLPVLRIGFFSFRRALSYTIIYKNIDNRAKEYRREKALDKRYDFEYYEKNLSAEWARRSCDTSVTSPVLCCATKNQRRKLFGSQTESR